MPTDRARARALDAIAARARALSAARGDEANRGELHRAVFFSGRREDASGVSDALRVGSARADSACVAFGDSRRAVGSAAGESSDSARKAPSAGGRGRAGVRCEDRLDCADAPGEMKEGAETDGGVANAAAEDSAVAFGGERTATGSWWSNGAFDAETGVAGWTVPAKLVRVADAPRRRWPASEGRDALGGRTSSSARRVSSTDSAARRRERRMKASRSSTEAVFSRSATFAFSV
jgi:hypothetical protein